jgi:hypothetical protein
MGGSFAKTIRRGGSHTPLPFTFMPMYGDAYPSAKVNKI